jgi:hypothetical protein
LRIECLRLQAEHIPMKRAPADEWFPPPQGKLTATLQPDAMNAIARTIDLLLQSALQAEHAFEALLGQFIPNSQGKARWPLRTRAGNIKLVQSHAQRPLRPGFREEVEFVAVMCERAKQPLQIQLRAPGRGELSADEREFHLMQEVLLHGRFREKKTLCLRVSEAAEGACDKARQACQASQPDCDGPQLPRGPVRPLRG